jgi:purine-binding chemotaxis protein CheW
MSTPVLSSSEITQYLTFAVGDEEYAIEILRVREIIAWTPLTVVPRAPAFVAGVMNLRGSVVPVVDLHTKLGLGPTRVTGVTCVVIVEMTTADRTATIGLLADDVRRVLDLTADEVEPPPSFGTRIDLAFLRGMGDVGGHFALILDIDKLLTSLELIATANVAASIQGDAPAPDPKKRAKRAATTEAAR